MRRCMTILLALSTFLALFCTPSRGAAGLQPGQIPLEAQAGQSLDVGQMQAFFDAYLGAQMSANHVAGASVAVVKDGRVIFSKGYGYANVAQNIPVDPQKTVFILGSLSKLFTWTAVMQLVEQGKLDLDTDVNAYLDFKIPATYPEPITLNHLMAHTAGFEDERFEQMAPTADQLAPLGEWLKTHIPARVRAPGQLSAYANYGTALAGYIVARMAGMSYDEYIEKNILAPLGMAHTTSRQPTPPNLEADLSQGYIFSEGQYIPQPGYNVAANVAPAASFRSTADDMARLMVAHLNAGRLENISILQPATTQWMHARSFSHAPQVNGMAHGFWEMDLNGEHILGHAGSHFIFSSCLMLFPAHNLGVFVAVNSQGGMAFLGGQNYIRFEKDFVDHFFPNTLSPLSASTDFARRAERYSGSYALTMGRTDTTPEKLIALLTSVDVQVAPDGLLVPALGNVRFVETAPLIFRQADGATRLVFQEDPTGNIKLAFLGSNPQTALVKNRWFETPIFNLSILGISLVVFFGYLGIVPASLWLRRKRAVPQPPSGWRSGATWCAGLVSLLSPVVVLGAFTSIFNLYGLYTGSLPLWAGVQFLSIVVAGLSVGVLLFSALAWVNRWWSLPGRIYYTWVAFASAAFTWFMYFWNILGKSF